MGGTCTTVDIAPEDPTITKHDKKVVTKTWHKFYKHWDSKHGPVFFMRLFKNHPEVKNTFQRFAAVSDDELLKSSGLRAHVVVFGSSVTTFVDKLDDTETLVALVQKLTDSHFTKGITNKAFFKTAFEALLAYMTEMEGLKPAQVASWIKITNLIISVIEDRIKDLS